MNLIKQLILPVLLFLSLTSWATNPDFELRRAAYIDSALINFSDNAVPIQAYEGLPLDQTALNAMLADVPTRSTADFVIVKLVRSLFFADSAYYDNQVLPVLNSFPFWLTKDEHLRSYWSENHHIMWMSSDWLLNQKYGRGVDPYLDSRLRNYLRNKVQYGFYEFFSSTYNPYTLTGLLNLADFAQDIEIRDLATQAAQRLMKEMLMLANNQGTFFPAAGRNYYRRYTEPDNGVTHITYLLTGFGPIPEGVSHAGAFLATTSVDLDDVINSWTPKLDTIYSIGHSLDSGFIVNQGLRDVDRIMAQWSSGGYFHPDVALQTGQLIADSNLWAHVDFDDIRFFEIVPTNDLPVVAENFSYLSKSTVISGQDVAIFKSNGVTLSSIQDFWKGKLGFQQFPVVANVGTTAVLTASGEVKSNWSIRSSNNANEHLPYVKQVENVALVMYRPEEFPDFLPFSNPEVALHFEDSDFDDIVSDDLWLMARQDENYVAVKRACTGTINGIQACEMNQGQTWVIMVGDSSMYSDFSNFQNVISQAQFEEEWYYDSVSTKNVYYASITVDNITIDYAWEADGSLPTSIFSHNNEAEAFSIYPNPTKGQVQIGLSKSGSKDVSIKILNVDGKVLYNEISKQYVTAPKSIDVSRLNPGVYFITVKTSGGISTRKLILN